MYKPVLDVSPMVEVASCRLNYKNGDYEMARVLDSNGSVLGTYQGGKVFDRNSIVVGKYEHNNIYANDANVTLVGRYLNGGISDANYKPIGQYPNNTYTITDTSYNVVCKYDGDGDGAAAAAVLLGLLKSSTSSCNDYDKPRDENVSIKKNMFDDIIIPLGMGTSFKNTTDNDNALFAAIRKDVKNNNCNDTSTPKTIYNKDFESVIIMAESGNASSQYILAVAYADGYGVERDIRKSIYWLTKSAEQGMAKAQCALGKIYSQGKYVEQNYDKAVEWYSKAAEQGDDEAQHALGVCYDDGNGVKQDDAKAMEWYRKAAEQGNAYGQYGLGVCYYSSGKFEQAMEWCCKAAEQGHANAQFILGVSYEEGKGVEQNLDKGVEWLRKAAKQGHADAKRLLELWSPIVSPNNSAVTQNVSPPNSNTNVSATTKIDSFTDQRDGKAYRTVKIGNNIWMAENLNYQTGNSCQYDVTQSLRSDDNVDCDKYGLLYDWNTAMKACPPGWRLPTNADWDALFNVVGGVSVAGKKLKSSTGWDWNGERADGNGTDEFGFSALPGGSRNSNGKFYNVLNFGYWWSATEVDNCKAYVKNMSYAYDNINSYESDKNDAFSVRCVQDVR